jgi:hypothetical protein
MTIRVNNNLNEYLAKMRQLAKEVPEKAVVRALNRTAEMARTDASRELQNKGYKLKARVIKDAIRIEPAKAGKLTATLAVKRKPIPLIEYSARQTAAGVSVLVQGQRKIINGAFIAVMPTGHKGVFTRSAAKTRKPNKKLKHLANGRHVVSSSGLPIRQLYGPSIGGAYSNERVQDSVRRKVAENFAKRLKVEIERLKRERAANRAAGRDYE